MALNIFEPRYRLMVRRCMEGNRAFGMATVNRQHQLSEVRPACRGGPPRPAGCRFGLQGRLQGRPRQAGQWLSWSSCPLMDSAHGCGGGGACQPASPKLNTRIPPTAQVACEAEITECQPLPDGR